MRQPDLPSDYVSQEVFDPAVGKPRGVLRKQDPPAGKFRHARLSPAPELVSWIDHYWMVSWDLRGCEPRLVESLPHPNVQVVFEKPESRAWGIATHRFSRVLEGKAHAFGIKFTPGGFYPFLRQAVSSLADSSLPAPEVLGPEALRLEQEILSTEDEARMKEAADAFLLARRPDPDAKATLAHELVERILHEPEIVSVEELAARSGMSVRSLQRLFSQYVGATPKWVIRRYRLHELLERMHSGTRLNWAQLAADLGYFDQAHLIHDFKAVTGVAPTEYPGLASRKDRQRSKQV